MKTKKIKKDLKPYNAVIQTCHKCGKVDVYLNDGHSCFMEAQRQVNDLKNKHEI